MKRSIKFLCVILSLIIALFSCGCTGLSDEERNSMINEFLSEVNSALEEGFSSLESSRAEANGYSDSESSADENESLPEEASIDEDGSYTAKDDVALYIYTYGKLPRNFMTKKEAEALGWKSGPLEPYAEGMCIGGDRFGNYEGLLPKKSGRQYTECDIDTLGAGSRGAKRIVFSNDGLIYYTDDHYESFTLLYGEE
ncbi:MAG: ribonuclease [Oscillospiraceae bacterium]|nr:ribonuclease [Oscillospiraceae bacterium]